MEELYKYLVSISTLISLFCAYIFKVYKLETKIEILTLRNEILEKININESNIKKIETEIFVKLQENKTQWEFTESTLSDIKKSMNLLFKKIEEGSKNA